MNLKRHDGNPRAKDDISEALAFEVPTDIPGRTYRLVPQYIHHYYPKGLRERCLGPYTRDQVGVTRYYPRTTPPIVIDFEPPEPEPWYRDIKLQFFLEQGVAYVPIGLRDVLSTEAFTERVEAAKRLAVASTVEARDLHALAAIGVGKDVESWLQDPVLVASIDAEALTVLQQQDDHRGKPLTGAARLQRLATIKKTLLAQLREDMKRGRVVDPLRRHRESTAAAQ